ncbi:hypothetical protein C2E20_0678 [Micractinium conductrix]|uniref:Uncharacterized protein n=1 Tax=Micractinium conductrix TaxID=554055 RepID=A0A2P6VQG9_9CHLO|nr:hypothetical protein C2E20_0678 [Micractinium conductrix]|eukprot:PSC76315.1 hypothetical protein C2E20_0678 [Micractinium conductrix]
MPVASATSSLARAPVPGLTPRRAVSAARRPAAVPRRAVTAAAGRGGAVIDRPGFETLGGNSGPATDSAGAKLDGGSSRGLGGGAWRVLLVDSEKHTEERVVLAIVAVIPGADESHAANCYHTARSLGMAIITSSPKDPRNTIWRAVAVGGSDGRFMAAARNGSVWYSLNSGSNWRETGSGQREWQCLSMSQDGQRLVAGVLGTAGGYLYLSMDAGATFTQITSAGLRRWTALSGSPSGTYQAAAVFGGSVYASSDGGVSWAERVLSGRRDWSALAIDTTGNKIVAAAGASFLFRTVALDATGSKLVMVDNAQASSLGGYIYTSTNTGADWTERQGAGRAHWSAVASSQDGSVLLAGVDGGPLWASYNSGDSWVQPYHDSDTAACLSRGTVVIIRGNARTKATLIGQRAIVRRAVGLGGWHWLQVLPSGEEVKLQRNALEVLERPTGHEQLDYSEEEEEEARRQQQAAAAAAATARGYAYEPAEPHAEDRPRPPRRPTSVPPSGRGTGGAAYEGDFGGLAARTRMTSSRGASSGQPRANLNKLQTSTLKRACTVYNLPTSEQDAANREALLDAVSEHFNAQQVDEAEVIACFLSAVKRHRMGLPR